MGRFRASAFAGTHKITTTKPARRLRQDRARDALIGPFLENRRMAKAVMIPQGNGLLKEAIIHLGREPRSKRANRGLAHLSRGFVWAGSVSSKSKTGACGHAGCERVTINPRQRMLIEIGNGNSAGRKRPPHW